MDDFGDGAESSAKNGPVWVFLAMMAGLIVLAFVVAAIN